MLKEWKTYGCGIINVVGSEKERQGQKINITYTGVQRLGWIDGFFQAVELPDQRSREVPMSGEPSVSEMLHFPSSW